MNISLFSPTRFIPDDSPYPSRLVLGWHSPRPIHVVVADNPDDQKNIAITVYEPHPSEWETELTRKVYNNNETVQAFATKVMPHFRR